MKKIITLSFTAIIALTAACSKSDDEPTVQLDITQPVSGQTFKTGDTVHIMGSASYVAAMHGYTVMVVSNTDTLFETDNHSHAATMTIHESWVNDVTAASQLKVIVTATIDHDGKGVSKEIPINIAP